MINISSRQLRIFVSAAKHLNFTRAAKEVHISPPAVSMQIKEIELQVRCSFIHKRRQKARAFIYRRIFFKSGTPYFTNIK